MQEPSYMIAIPKDQSILEDPKNFIGNLTSCGFIKINDMDLDDDRGLVIDLTIGDNDYEVEVNPTGVEIPEFVRPEHAFSDEEVSMLDKAEAGLSVCFDYEGDSNQCFHDQLKIIDALFPDLLAVLDCPSEKLLSGKWVSLAAKSSVLPAPRYLFTVQAISDGGDEVWLHTHGLKRCGLYELEILNSNKEFFNDHYKMIEAFALRMLESDEPIEPGDAVFIGQAAGKQLTLTAVDWKEALEHYPDITLGVEEDRDDGVHSEDTCVLMIYKNDKAEEEMIYTPVDDFNQFLGQNPMFYFSNEETRRMSALARERLPYMLKAFENKENTIIAKIGLIIDKEHWSSEDKPEREHIWFEIKDIKDGSVVGELTQEPYYVSGMKQGDTGTYPFSDITDWLIFTKECRVSPDDAYLLE